MTEKMEENNGSLSIFGTDFASKGFSWAGNLYQKWENICRENITAQDPSKFVDAVSEQFRKICEEVADDWLNPFSDGCVKGPVSDLSLEQDVIAEICKKSMIGHDENPKNEGSVIFNSSEEDTRIAPLLVIGQDVREEACGIFNKKVSMPPSEVTIYSCSSETREDHEEVSLNLVNHPGPLSSADLLLSEFPEKNGNSTSEEAISSIRFIANVYEAKSNSSEPDMPLSPRELADTNIENEEFEDVKLEELFEEKKLVDCWEDAEKYELASIPHQAMKNRSYKKKLRDVFNSNFYSPKKKSSNHGASFDGAIGVVSVERDITASSVSSGGLQSTDLATTESCEPDWELL